MQKFFTKIILLIGFVSFVQINTFAQETAKWISTKSPDRDKTNTWIAFRKDFIIDEVPAKAITHIAVDSKYWLWVNGELVVFEGGLKRGPNPNDTYYDELDLSPFLIEGDNKIAVLVWFFGKDGFSHINSGRSGLYFDMNLGSTKIVSNEKWLSRVHPAYKTALGESPNFRLPESNIRFEAYNDIIDWQESNELKSLLGFTNSLELAEKGGAPWNKLVKRNIPFWKDFGIKRINYSLRLEGDTVDTLIYHFPYNLQMTPILELSSKSPEEVIDIYTDNTYAGGDVNLRAQYATKTGYQYYESLGWLSGHKLYVVCPKNVELKNVYYRETGYNSDPIGSFSCDDNFVMNFWDKALRTLYVNMRDTFFDCPERERAQWWGDVVLLMAESFYTFSNTTHDLMKKAIYELVNWQRDNGELFSPIPAGNYNTELPGQMLASIGEYGFWNYYLNTGDLTTLKYVYPHVKKYLDVWELDEKGLTKFRSGDWTWGDWGDNKDIRLIFAGWHYIALKTAVKMAEEIGEVQDVGHYQEQIGSIYKAFNSCWTGEYYKHPDYNLEIDDRVQALAVLSGIADSAKYEAIYKVLQNEFHSSPYMEKYVMEALFKMGYGEYGLSRMKERFASMVENTEYTTLFEGWEIGDEGFGGGTVNHAWSGGPLIVIAQYICGIMPSKPGYSEFIIAPDIRHFNRCSIDVPSIKGIIHSSFVKNTNGVYFKISVPSETLAEFRIPEQCKSLDLYINGEKYSLSIGESNVLLEPGDYKVQFKQY